MNKTNKKPRAAADLPLPTVPDRDPESVWLGRVQQIYDPRAFQWVLKVRDARKRQIVPEADQPSEWCVNSQPTRGD